MLYVMYFKLPTMKPVVLIMAVCFLACFCLISFPSPGKTQVLSQKAQECLYEAKRCLEALNDTPVSPEKIGTLKRAIGFARRAKTSAPGSPEIAAIIEKLDSLKIQVVTEGITAARHLMTAGDFAAYLQAYELLERLLELDPDNNVILELRNQILTVIKIEKAAGAAAPLPEQREALLTSMYRRAIQSARDCHWEKASSQFDEILRMTPWFSLQKTSPRGWEHLPLWSLKELADLSCSVGTSMKNGAHFYGLETPGPSTDHQRAALEFSHALSGLNRINKLIQTVNTGKTTMSADLSASHIPADLTSTIRSEEPGFAWLLQAEYISRRFLGVLLAEKARSFSGLEGDELAEKAVIHLTRAAAYAFAGEPVGPKDQKLHFWLGYCLHRMRMYKAAFSAFETSLDSLPALPFLKGDDANPDPGAAERSRWQSWIKCNNGKLIVLVSGLLAGITGFVLLVMSVMNRKRSPGPAFYQGLKLQRKQRFREACDSFEAASSLAESISNPMAQALCLNCLGVVLTKLEHFEKAERAFAQAHEVFPTLPHPALNLSKLRVATAISGNAIFRLIRHAYLTAYSARWSGLPESDLLLLPAVGSVFPAGSPERKLAEESEMLLRSDKQE